MSSLIIDVDNQISTIIVKGNIDELLSIRYMKLFLKQLGAQINDNVISIRYDEGRYVSIFNELTETFKEEGFDFEYSDNIEEEFNHYVEDTKNFEIFSKQAYDIRENNLEKADFDEFLKVVKEKVIGRKLYRLQYLSAYHLAFSQNSCNFSVPGAGKTSIVYGAYSYLKSLNSDNEKSVNKILVVGPLSSFGPWESEYHECFNEKVSCTRLAGGMDIRQKTNYLYSNLTDELTLISYQGVINLVDELKYFLKNNKVLVVLDEAHKIKNTDDGKSANAILELAKYAKGRVVLTGTPSPNSYKDLYNLFKFIWPTKDIIKYPLNQLEVMSNIDNDPRVPDLIENLKPFFIRIKKSDLLDIPPAIDNPPILVKMGTHQKQVYDFIEKKIRRFLEDNGNVDNDIKAMLSKAKLIRLMQVSTNPSLLLDSIDEYLSNLKEQDENMVIGDSYIYNIIKNYDSIEIPSKYIKCRELIDNITRKGRKVVIWTTFISNILGLKKYLEESGYKILHIYGDTPLQEKYEDVLTREQIIKKFHEDNEYKILITNPFSVAESISLHKACHDAIYLERTFNAAHFIQSKDRIHRYGLKKEDKINYWYLLSEGTIDIKIHEVLNNKQRRMVEIIESEEIPLFNNIDDEAVSDEDILEMMRNYER